MVPGTCAWHRCQARVPGTNSLPAGEAVEVGGVVEGGAVVLRLPDYLGETFHHRVPSCVFVVVFRRKLGERGLAQRVERALKLLSKAEKEALVARRPTLRTLLKLVP